MQAEGGGVTRVLALVAVLCAGLLGIYLASKSGWPAMQSGPAQMTGPFHSDLPGIAIVPAHAIPIYRGGPSGHACVAPPLSPSAEAQAVAAGGWVVEQEAVAGAYRLITFIGRSESNTNSDCRRFGGGIALFKGGELQALAWDLRQGVIGRRDQPTLDRNVMGQGESRMGDAGGSTAYRPATLAALRPLDEGGLRIFRGARIDGPVADIRFEQDGSVRLTRQAAVDMVCQARARLPNIHGLSMVRARGSLARYGWVPHVERNDDLIHDAVAYRLHRQGMTEVIGCAPTGMGFCGFSYGTDAGELYVTTVGDGSDQRVVDYVVRCR